MVKRISCGALAALLLLTAAGCGGSVPPAGSAAPLLSPPPAASAPAALPTLDNYPVVDGSTACLPLMAQVMSSVCGIPVGEAEACCTASKTAQSWRNLASGAADLLLVYEAPAEVQKELESGPALDIAPIGRDALVFIVNEQNPVESLTRSQLVAIYAGRIVNWSEVGGPDQPIVAFQRDETSGSQTLFKKLLMGPEPLMDAPTELRPGMMGGLIDGLAGYSGAGNALGYSVFYYASEMYQKPGLKFLAVDGVLPSAGTIGDGTYPLTNEFYAAVRAETGADAPARQLFNWVCGPAGRQAVQAAGYVPAG
ncbi:PstS family phosphate ABC transporter substrate-binding protein [Allofournierella sp.]|uniref:PstS family phosphate ABC transporter substrate-binding protein n=1 Tax=Allofournierella sp. TaxID=1940256 RepID=UPI003AB6A6D8